ncbi:MAG: hypothetical protein O7F11_09885, partial [Acidobacteria bacterium]|nr:hypothetical protein [Acidobacteriota bacterium]
MHVRFRWTFLLTLVAVSLVAAPLAVTAADSGTGLRSLQIRTAKDEPGKSDADGTMMSPVVMYDRSFAPVMESLNQGARFIVKHGGEWVSTPSGYLRLSALDESP